MHSSEDYFYHLCVLIPKAASGLLLLLHSSLLPLNSYKIQKASVLKVSILLQP